MRESPFFLARPSVGRGSFVFVLVKHNYGRGWDVLGGISGDDAGRRHDEDVKCCDTWT